MNSNVKLGGSGKHLQEKKGFTEILSSRSPTDASKHDPSDMPCGQTSCLSRSVSPLLPWRRVLASWCRPWQEIESGQWQQQ